MTEDKLDTIIKLLSKIYNHLLGVRSNNKQFCCKCDKKIEYGHIAWPCKCGYQCVDCENYDRGC